MKHGLQLLSLFLFISLTSCINATSINLNGGAQIKGNGNIVVESRKLDKDFSKVVAQGIVNVYLTKGATQELEIEAEENLIELIVIENKDGVLQIRTEGSLSTSKKINIHVVYKDLDEITSTGSTDVYVKSTLTSHTITLTSSGASDIDLTTIEANSIFLNASGSSDIDIRSEAISDNISIYSSGSADINIRSIESSKLDLRSSGSSDISIRNVIATNTEALLNGASTISLSGKTDNLDVKASGSSDFKGKSFLSNTANVFSEGSSSSLIHVSEKLISKSTGSSDIIYYGNPKQVTEDKKGAASIKQR